MRRYALLACAILTIPAAATAQRGGRGGGGSGAPAGGTASGPRAPRPATAGQIEDLNIAKLMLDKRKKLALADSQVNQMKALEKTIKDRNAALLAQYDSVRSDIRFGNATPVPGSMGATMGNGGNRDRNSASGSGSTAQTPEEAARMRRQLGELRAIGAQIRERRTGDLAEVLALLTAEQQKVAAELLKDQEEDVERFLPLGGRGG